MFRENPTLKLEGPGNPMRRALLPDFPQPLVFAHRGLSTVFPENTLVSFRAARDSGIPGIELDVHLTKDHKLVVFHDDTTQRIVGPAAGASGASGTSGKDGASYSIEASDYAFLATLDIGSWKDKAFSGERMPLLEDVFSEFGETLYIDIEIKSRTVGDQGLETLLAEAIRKFGMERRCIVSSFNPFALRRFKKLCPEVATAIIYSRSSELYWFLRRGEGRWIGNVDILKPEHVLVKRRRIFERFLRPILPWTVDIDRDAERVVAAGAAGIISNCPQQLCVTQKSP